MPAELERDLSLYAVVTVSIGAMIGSGIFVLPGLAFDIAGPAVILAYLLAGLVVLPAALSKAEMGTAMPESGGTYLYIDRAMGPFFGTIAGLGAWFSLVFKSAFALVGLGAYLVVLVAVSSGVVKLVALGLGVALVAVNLVGVKQTGRLQAAIVTLVLAVLVVYIADGLTFVDNARYHPFFGSGPTRLLEATGFVFVSYAGVTKIASVAEEVEDPDRNLPAGILLSMGVMLLVYTFLVYVVVGVSEPATLADTLTPMAVAAEQFLGAFGDWLIVGVAVLALTSMANAGVLSSSRYPFAMSRDSLAPATLGRVSDRFGTPVAAIGFTGGVLLVLVAAVPVFQLAKLASAFQILVFSMENLALIAFRESDLRSYDPSFEAPGYPWFQLFGIGGGLLLLTQMGPVPLGGAVGIIVVGVGWYRLYGREKTEREGAALDAIRRSWTDRALAQTREACEVGRPERVLIPIGREPTGERRREFLELVRLAADVVRPSAGDVQVVHFQEVPEQLDLEAAAADTPDLASMALDGALPDDRDVPVEFGETVTHDAKRAVSSFVDRHDVDLVIGAWHPSRWRAELLGADVDWYMRHTASDFVFVRARGYDGLDRLTVIADRGPFDPLEVVVADGVATAHGATIEFVATLPEAATDEQVGTATEYLESLSGFCRAPAEVTVARSDDRIEGMVEAAADADLAVVGTSAHHLVVDVLFGTVPDRLVERLDCTVLLTHTWRPRRHTFIRVLLDRFVY
ncbi:MAG: APC family permease [Halobacteriales archaeon]